MIRILFILLTAPKQTSQSSLKTSIAEKERITVKSKPGNDYCSLKIKPP